MNKIEIKIRYKNISYLLRKLIAKKLALSYGATIVSWDINKSGMIFLMLNKTEIP